MTSCDDIDLLAFLEGRETSPEQGRHLEACPECRAELQRLKSLVARLDAYFMEAQTGDCPRRQEIVEHLLDTDADLPEGLASHAASCPDCAGTMLLLQDFVSGAGEPFDSVSLPDALSRAVAKYRSGRVKARTSSVLERLVRAGRKGADWVAGVAEDALSGRDPLGVPAAPDDLTKAKGDREPEPEAKEDDPESGNDQEK